MAATKTVITIQKIVAKRSTKPTLIHRTWLGIEALQLKWEGSQFKPH